MKTYTQTFIEKYQRMAKAGHSVQVVQQMVSIDVQCTPNDPRLVQVVLYLAGGGGPIPVDALEDLLRTKYNRMKDKGISNEKVEIYKYLDSQTSEKKMVFYELAQELEGVGKLTEDRTLGDKEDLVFTESQLRAAELKKEALSLRTPFKKTVVEDLEEVDTAPLVGMGGELSSGDQTEFHSKKGMFPFPEVLREEREEEGGCVFREHVRERLLTFGNVLTKEQCKILKEKLDFTEEEQKLQGDLLKKAILYKQPVIRTNIRRHFIDNQLSLIVWRAVKGRLPKVLADGRKLVGVRTKMNYYRYGPGQYFKTHIDGGFRFTATGETSEYTFILYLNDDFVGGTTRFCPLPEWNNEPREVVPVQGDMLVFRQRDTKHCGVTLESGYKHILQGMVMYGPLRVNALGHPFGKEAQIFHTCDC